MTIKLNEYDKRLLSQITPSSKWDKLKSIYAINSVIKQLKIGNKKIGLKCAKHLQKLSKQNTTSLQEIREGCRDLKIPKQKLPLAKDKTKREVESVHKINKATDKAPTDKTTGGGGGGGRKGGGGGGGGKAQPQADLIGGLFTAFKAQEAKQARDSQFNLLSREMNRDINLNLARTEQRAREEAGLGRAFGSQDTSLQALKTALFTQREAKELGERNVPSLTSAENRVLDALIKDKRPNPLDLLQVNPEQDLTNVSIPSTPRTASSVSSLSDISSLSSSSMFNPTQEEKNKLAMQLLDEREKNLSSVQASVKRKQEMLKEKVAEADIYAEQQRQSMIQNKIGIQTENYINREREEIKSNVLNKNMNHKEAQKKLQQLNTFYLKQLDYEQQQRVNKNIFDDIEQIERDRQFRLRNRKVGVDSVLSRLRNNESQEKQDRLVNDLIINQNEKKIEDLQSELLGVVSSRAMQKQKGKENRQEQIDLLRARMRNQSVEQQETQGFTFNPPTNPDLSSIQQNVLTNVEDRLEQQNADRAMREFVSRQNLNEFNQQSQPLGLTRTSSLSLLDRMEADSLRQLQQNQDLQRTLSAGDTPSQDLDVERAKKKLREQQESEALFNRKQQELAQEIKNLKTEPPLMAFGQKDNTTARPIEKKVSPREIPFEEQRAIYRLRDLGYVMLEENAFLRDDETQFNHFFNRNLTSPYYRDEAKYTTPDFAEQVFEDFKKGVPLGERPISEKRKAHNKEMALLEPVWNKINKDIHRKFLTNIPKNERDVDIGFRGIDPAKVPIELRTNEEVQKILDEHKYRGWRDVISFEEREGFGRQDFDTISQLQEYTDRYNLELLQNYTKQERQERGLKQIDFDKEYLPLIPPEKYDLWGYSEEATRYHSEPLREDSD